MALRFENKVAIITGAGRGIGYEIAYQLVSEGASVILNDIDDHVASEAALKLNTKGPGNCIAVPGDAGDLHLVNKIVLEAVSRFGRLDIAIANAGCTLFNNFFDVELKDFRKINKEPVDILNSPLGMMFFQQYVERKAFTAGGGKFVAPAQRLIDFCENRVSSSLPACSYLPGVISNSLIEVLPSFIYKRLQQAFKEFGKKMKGYFTNDAIILATESRTSSPVRIPRDAETLRPCHQQREQKKHGEA